MTEWLVASGVNKTRITHTDNKQWLAFDATVSEMENLLHTKYYNYEQSSQRYAAGCNEYYLPENLQAHIDFIKPVIMRSSLTAPGKMIKERASTAGNVAHAVGTKRDSTDLSNCYNVVTPACIRALCDLPLPDTSERVDNALSMGIFETGQTSSQEDLNEFFRSYAPYIPNGTSPILASVDGGGGPVSQGNAGGEADLDFQVAYAVVFPQKLIMYSVDDAYLYGPIRQQY